MISDIFCGDDKACPLTLTLLLSSLQRISATIEFRSLPYMNSITTTVLNLLQLLIANISQTSISSQSDTVQTLLQPSASPQTVASLSAFVETTSTCTGGGYISSQSSQHIHQYTTLMSPNKGERAVCGGSTIFCLG